MNSGSPLTVTELLYVLGDSDPDWPVCCVGVAYRTRSSSTPDKPWATDVVLLQAAPTAKHAAPCGDR